MYARASRACIEAGTGVSQSDNAFDTHRAIAILSALSGNLDAPGGDVIWDPMPIEGRRGFPRTDLLSEEQAAKRIGGTAHKVLSMSGWVAPGDLQEAILRDSPYRISSMVVFGSNPLVSHENATATEAALTKLDFLAVADMFMTPTARLADIVLPASSWLERDQIVEFNSYIAARQRVVTVEGARSDEEMILDLARRLGLGHHFYPSLEDALDAKLSGIDLDVAAVQEDRPPPQHPAVPQVRDSRFPYPLRAGGPGPSGARGHGLRRRPGLPAAGLHHAASCRSS